MSPEPSITPNDSVTTEREQLVTECLKCNNEQNKTFLEQTRNHYNFQKPLKWVGAFLVFIEGVIGIWLALKAAFISYPDTSDHLQQDVILCLGLLIIAAITLKVTNGSSPGGPPPPPSGIDDKTRPNPNPTPSPGGR